MKYHINALQYHALPILLRVTQQQMCRRIGVTNNYMCRHLDDGEFRVDTALALCNAYRIPLSIFVVTDEEERICSPTIQVDEAEWVPLTYSPATLRSKLKKDDVSFSSIMRLTGWQRRTIEGLFNMKCPLAKLIKFCNDMRYNLGDFINDKSLARIVTASSDMTRENSRLKSELSSAKERIAVLERAMKKIAYSSSLTDTTRLALTLIDSASDKGMLKAAEKEILT